MYVHMYMYTYIHTYIYTDRWRRWASSIVTFSLCANCSSPCASALRSALRRVRRICVCICVCRVCDEACETCLIHMRGSTCLQLRSQSDVARISFVYTKDMIEAITQSVRRGSWSLATHMYESCDMTHTYVWQDSFRCVTRASFTCVARHVCICDMPPSSSPSCAGVTLLMLICGMTRVHVCMCDMTHSSLPYASFLVALLIARLSLLIARLIPRCPTRLIPRCPTPARCTTHSSSLSPSFFVAPLIPRCPTRLIPHCAT